MAEKTFSPVRARAATVEAAIAQALQMTGVSREEIEIEVLEETEKGAVIRIAPIGTNASSSQSTPAAEEQADSSGAEDESDSQDEVDVEQESAPEEAPLLTEEVEAEESAPEPEAAQERSTPVVAAPREMPPVRLASPEVAEHARTLAQEMLDYMGLEAQANIADLPDWCLPTSHDKTSRVRDVPRAFLQIEGEDVGILIGKHGQTLQSFQYLLNLSLNNSSEGEEASADGVRSGGVHVVTDAGEYRGRRAEALNEAARDAAESARRDQRSIRMEPMPGHERRLVHLALFEEKDIVTTSEGREPMRRVVVTPEGVTPPRNEERGESNNRYRNERSGGGGGNRGGASGGGYGSSRGGSGNSGSGNRGYGSGAGGGAGRGRKSYN